MALCEELCDEKRFRKYVGGPIVEIRRAVHASLFTAFESETDAVWGPHHRLFWPLLTPDAVAQRFTEARDIAAELTAKWRNLGDKAVVAPISELNRLDLETTNFCFYGMRINGLSGPEHPWIAAMNNSTGEAVMRPTRPKIMNWLFYQSKFYKASDAMRDYAKQCVKYRKEHPTDRKDLLWTMMNAKDPETGNGLSDEAVIDEIVTMPIGSSTAPCAVSTAIYYLLKNPECITKAQAEIDFVIGPDDELLHDHIAKLPYSTAIMQETMRLCVPAPGFNIEPIPEITKGPVSLAGGKYQVPANQTMIVVLHGVSRDPAVFEDPEAFKPERMLDGKFEQLPEGAKKWFGNGKRVCIGRHYAWMWNMIALVTLLKDVDFEMKDPAYKLKQQGWFNLRPVGFEVKVSARQRQ